MTVVPPAIHADLSELGRAVSPEIGGAASSGIGRGEPSVAGRGEHGEGFRVVERMEARR
ncbi:hypothetical protein GCM10010116_44870 [Microbispora rosea subsp. aerata]|nr:hypothetical protein GCM10010116_44870 [Microbispora rosea subsp. aerata]GIH57482.1 hypothetical protein Mro02_43960 [Microbispora rosea subsp. aerata]GLJ86432.1 hypothetical protein GCM10017588_51690 [Microbispora rosea subsp. aerata]